MTLQEIAALYPGGRFSRPDHYETRCPLPAHKHGDRRPGLGFTRAADGRILCKCQLGCETAAVLAEKGLTFADLAPPSRNGSSARSEEPEAVYIYHWASGEAACEKVRLPGKRFFFRLPGAEKGGLGGLIPPLYRLPDLLATEPGALIGIGEGEKDADNLCRHGLPSTCNPHGASRPGQATKWRRDDTEWLLHYLPDRQFLVFADQDEAGFAHAQSVFDALKAAGLRVRIAALSGLSEGDDVSDWLGRHSQAEFEALWHPAPLEKPWASARELMAKEIPPLEWIVPGIIPEGLTILAGRPKQGKSWGIYGVGVAVSTGGKAFGVRRVKQGDVLYLALEDGDRRLKERLSIILRGGPIPERFDWAIKWPRLAGPGHVPTRENPDCRSQILWWLDEHPEARLIAVDTLAKVKPPSRKNGNAYEQDYAAMEPLQQVASERRLGLVLVTHTRKPLKGNSAADVFDEIMDSTGITGGADTLLVLKKTRREQELSLWITGRDVDDQELLIEWDADTSDWKLLGPAQEQRITALRQAILTCLKRTGEVMGFGEVAARIDRDTPEGRSIVKTTLYRMADQDQVISVSPGKFRHKPPKDGLFG